MVRAVDPARLARAALELPPGQRRPAEPEAPDHPLTVREQALFRAATRRALRAATGLAGITVAVLAPVNALGMTALFPERQTQILTINGIVAVVGLGVAVLVLGRWRLPPLPPAVGLAFSTVMGVLFLLVFVPASRTTSFMLLVLIPPAVALFLPWTVAAQAALLLAGAAALAVFTVLPVPSCRPRRA